MLICSTRADKGFVPPPPEVFVVCSSLGNRTDLMLYLMSPLSSPRTPRSALSSLAHLAFI